MGTSILTIRELLISAETDSQCAAPRSRPLGIAIFIILLSLAPPVQAAVERELAGGEHHSYDIVLAPNEFLRATVDQLGGDVALILNGPDGLKILETNYHERAFGREILWFQPSSGGTYRLDVSSRELKGSVGRYKLRMDHQLSATTADLDLLAAQAQLAAGRQLLKRATASEQRESLETFTTALSVFQSTSLREMQAVTLIQLACAFELLGEGQKARDHYDQALALAQQISDPHLEADILNRLGDHYRELREKETALNYYGRALETSKRLGYRRSQAHALLEIGETYFSTGDHQLARDNYIEALRLSRAISYRPLEARALTNLGTTYHYLGEKQLAREHYEQSLKINDATGDKRGESGNLNNLGYLYVGLGQSEKAIDFFNRSLQLHRELGNREFEAVSLSNIGLAYKTSGDWETALDYYQRSLNIFRSIGRDESVVLMQIADIYRSQNKLSEALDLYKRVSASAREKELRPLEAVVLARTAVAERAGGNLPEARRNIEAAMAIIEATRTGVGSRRLRASFVANVQWHFEFYIDLLMQMHQQDPAGGFDRLAFEASERTRAQGIKETLSEALSKIQHGVDPTLLEQERALRLELIAKTERQARLRNDKQQQELLGGEIKQLLEQYDEVETKIRVSSPRYLELSHAPRLSLPEIQRQLGSDTLLLEFSLGKDRSYLWLVSSTSLKSFVLPGRHEIERAALRVYDLLTARNRRLKFERPSGVKARVAQADAEYPHAARELSNMLLAPVKDSIENKRLLIVAEGALEYVPFAALTLSDNDRRQSKRTAARHFVPLIVDHEVINIPSASALAVLRRWLATREEPGKTLAILADPVFDRDDERVRTRITAAHTHQTTTSFQFKTKSENPEPTLSDFIRSARESGLDEAVLQMPRLAHTRREAVEIAQLVSRSDRSLWLDFAANRSTAINPELAGYRYVHFATHGFLNPKHPELSGLVLSLVDRNGQDQNGFLRLYDIFKLNLNADLVVLSGCNTGLGKEIKGEGLVGLTHGLLYAGTARVIVSLWGIPDEASADLMVQLYKGLLGKRRLHPAAALRQAQIKIWNERRWSAPYYWAGFVLRGEPN